MRSRRAMDLYGEMGVEGTASGWAAVPTIVPSTARRRASVKLPAPPTSSSVSTAAAAAPIKMAIAFRPATLSSRRRTASAAKRVRGSAASTQVARPPSSALTPDATEPAAPPASASFLRGVQNEYNPRHPNDYNAYVEAKSNERKRQKMERQLSDDAERRRRQAEERKRRGVEGALADVRGLASDPAGGARLRGFGGGGGASAGVRGSGTLGRGRGATVPAWMQKRLNDEERAPAHRALGRGAAAPSSAFAAAAAAATAAIANALLSAA